MTGNDPHTSLERGAALIRMLARTLPDTPGVYRMLNEKGDPLYIGKALSLKKRVLSYANTAKLPVRLQRMVAQTTDMVFVHTHTEVEALLLESNLIKKYKPRYNVLLRDDKSFPYIMLTGDHDFPLLTKHRGARTAKGDYYGPFASGGAVNRTMIAMQKAFMLRNCSDSTFSQRQRPCLQFHIKRCTAPCVLNVSAEEYAQQVADAKAFLAGKSRQIQDRLASEMQAASERQDFETAALIRDRIRALTAVQAKQDINVSGIDDADVVGLSRQGPHSCIQIFFFRAGQNFGNRAFFPRHAEEEEDKDIIAAFLAQFYENKPVPPEIIVSEIPAEKDLLAEALGSRRGPGKKVEIASPQRGPRKRLIDFVIANAREALAQENLKIAGEKKYLEGVGRLVGLEEDIARIEVYDNSHLSGTNMTGVMIVAGPEGFRKTAYRKFNTRAEEGADDYAMMREVMRRRFARALQEGKGPGTADWPDLLLIDGGAGQLSAVYDVLDELAIADDLRVLAISKGPDRHAGREKFLMRGRDVFELPPDDPVLHYLQRLRDEAHRFAVGAHRVRRKNQISESPIDSIPGIGPKRKKALLMHFGSGQDVTRAGLADLEKVEGISSAVARRIYDFFHDSGQG